MRLLAGVMVLSLASASLWAGERDEAAGQEVLARYLQAKETQQMGLRGVQMEVDIEAQLPRLEKRGKLHALKSISRLGKITYKALGFSGDNTIKNEVITRYLAEETKSRENSITPANYKFKYKGLSKHDGVQVYVFEVTPHKKMQGLFKGELWLDEATALPVREAGRVVKTPSIFLKKMVFVQDYQIRDGLAIPKHFQGTADVRIIGRAELSIDFSNFSRQEAADDSNNLYR